MAELSLGRKLDIFLCVQVCLFFFSRLAIQFILEFRYIKC